MWTQSPDTQVNLIYGHMLKWKFYLNLIAALMLTLSLTGCQQHKPIIPKYDGNFPTSQIRSLWMVCSVSWKQKNPFMPQTLLWQVCDCYTDTIRKNLTPEEVDGQEKITRIDLTKVLTEKCNTMIPPIKPT